MGKLRVIAPLVLLVFLGSLAAVYVKATHAGLSAAPAAPETLIPASAELYMGLNRGDQGAALAHLWSVYQAHPGTSAALAHLRVEMKKDDANVEQALSLFSSLGDQAAVAMWMPPRDGQDPTAVVVAQLKALDLLTGKNPLHGLATSAPAWSYRGTQVYSITFKGASKPAYGCIISGDGVLATDKQALQAVIDTTAAHTPALATDKDYTATMATLPASRAFTLYVTPALMNRAVKEMDNGFMQGFDGSSTAPQNVQEQVRKLLPRAAARPFGLAMTASTDGIGFTSTAQPTTAPSAAPSDAASIFGRNALFYVSVSDLGGLLDQALQMAPAGTLAQVQQQTGIDVRRDLLSWMHGEFALEVNDGPDPLLQQALTALAAQPGIDGATGAAQPAAALPGGSLELAWRVDDPAAVQQSLQHIYSAAARGMGNSGHMALPSPSTLPDGSQAYTFSIAPGLGYQFHNHWLVLSTNLTGDAWASLQPLASDSAYKAAVAHLSGAPADVSYFNVTRTLALADKWIAYARTVAPAAMQSAARDGWTWPQVEALLAPVQNVLSASVQGTHGRSGEVFISIK